MHRDQVISEGKEAGTKEGASLLVTYFGSDGKTFGVFALVLLIAIAVGTVPYVLVVGYDKWSRDLGAATHMMLADFPVTPPPQAPYGYALIPAATAPSPTLPNGCTRQYTCPSCGASGLPAPNAAGQPTCANCGSLMATAPRAGYLPAAAA